MKYNIRKYIGGGVYTQFSPILPSAPTQPSGYTGEAKKEEKTSILDDKLYKELIDAKGLVSDVNVLVDQIAELESSPFAYLDQNNRQMSFMILKKINELENSRQNWDKTIQIAKESGGLGEVAVGSMGEMYVKDETGKVKPISVNQYVKDRDKFNPLTVSELMNLRKYSEQLAFTSDIFSVAQQSIGLEKISKNVRDMLSIMNEYSDTTERYYSKNQIVDQIRQISGRTPGKEEIEALKLLTEIASTPGEYYKVVNESSSKRNNANKALNFIWSSLGREAQLKLKANAALNGETNPAKIIEDMIFVSSEPKTVSRISPVSESSITSSSGEKGLENLTAFQIFHKEKTMGSLAQFSLNDNKTGILFRGSIGAVSPLMTRKDQAIGQATLRSILEEGDYKLLVNNSQVYFGDKKVGVENLNNIIYDGQDAAKVYMPITGDGKPDYEGFKDFKEIYSVFEQQKNVWSKEQAERYFKENGYNYVKIDEVGGEKIIRENAYIKPFLVMYGWTNSATGLTKDNEWITQLNKQERDLILPILKQVWTVGTGKNVKDLTPDASWHREKYYKGIITIPYRKEATAIVDSLVGQGPKDKPSTILDVQRNLWASSGIPTTRSGAANTLNE